VTRFLEEAPPPAGGVVSLLLLLLLLLLLEWNTVRISVEVVSPLDVTYTGTQQIALFYILQLQLNIK
jgi:hypothetical protein